MRRTAICMMLVAAFAGAVNAGSVGGTVTEEGTTDPIADATVTMYTTSLKPQVVAVNKDGTYSFDHTGPYKLVAEAPGFHPDSLIDTVGAKEAQQVDFALVPDSTIILQYGAIEGVVTDSATGSPLANALVILAVRSGSERRWAPTDSTVSTHEGTYAFDSVIATTIMVSGEYRLITERTGYTKTDTFPIYISPDETVTIDIALPPLGTSVHHPCRAVAASRSQAFQVSRQGRSALHVVSPVSGRVSLLTLNGSLAASWEVEQGASSCYLPPAVWRGCNAFVAELRSGAGYTGETVLVR